MSIMLSGCHGRSGEKKAADKAAEGDSATAVVSAPKPEPADTATKAPEVKDEPIAEEPILEMVTSMGSMRIKLYKGCRHQIMHDVCKAAFTEDILRFIGAR